MAIKTSGNVFTVDTIESLNRKPKFWKDLIDDTAFTAKDIISLQDPKQIEKRTIMNFHHVRKKIKFTPVVNKQGLEDKLDEMDYF